MKTNASICKENGWVVGDVLEGTEFFREGQETCQIQITAIGEKMILAKRVWSTSGNHTSDEGLWTLSHREWKKVESTNV
jgi:hypothetical protein